MPEAPVKQPYQDTSVQDWMGVIKTELDIPKHSAIAPITNPPTPETKPEPKPEKPDEIKTEPVEGAAKTSKPDTKPAGEPSASEPSPEDKWPRTAVEWDNRKKAQQARLDAVAKERDEIKAERDRIKTEIEQVRKQGPSPELDQLKKERDELSDRLRLVSVEQHPKFKAYFENKTNAQLELAKRIAGNGKGDRIVELLKAQEGPLRDQELEMALGELNTVQQARIASVLNSLADIDAERSSEIAKARDSYEKIQSDQTESEKQAIFKAEQSFNDMIVSVSDKSKGNILFQKKDGDEDWNKGVDQRVLMAKTLIFGNPGQENMMKAALAAVSVPAILEHAKNLTSENERLQAQIKELTAAQPKVEGAQTQPGGKTPPVPKKQGYDSDPMQAAKNWMQTIHAPVEGQ